MKIMMSKVQSTKVKTEYVIRVFQQENSDGKLAMKTAVRLGAALLLNILTTGDWLWIPVYGCRVHRDGCCSTSSWLCTSIHSDMFWNLYLGNGKLEIICKHPRI